jgi:D-3-phosphoglycerate dehydrogenase
MGFRIFLTGSGVAPAARAYLTERDCTLMTGDPKDGPEDLIRKLAEFKPHALIVRQGQITDAVQGAAPDLAVICKHGVGTDNIDVDAATRRGIPVFYTPRANFESAAEHTLGLLLALVRRIPEHDRRIRGGVFDKKAYDGLELLGKTLGLVGFGQIGRRVAQLVAPFRMSVLAYHPSRTAEALPDYIRKVGSVEDIFRDADIVSLHCPLTDTTRTLINTDSISRMRNGVHLINTARGELIDEAALVSALKAGRIRGAALDVFATEPPPADHPLFGLDNVIVTTHVAGVSDNSSINMGMDSARNVLAVLNGEDLDRMALKNPAVLSGRH